MIVAHHLTAGAAGRADLVRDDGDRHDLVEGVRDAFGARTLGWCLMDTHVHLVVEGDDGAGAADRLERALATYARGFNERHGLAGRLRGPVDVRAKVGPEEIARAISYGHGNPLRARNSSIERAFEYRWSGARELAGISLAGVLNVARARFACGPFASWLGGTMVLADIDPAPVSLHSPEVLLAAAAETYLLPPAALAGPGRDERSLAARALFLRLGQIESLSVRQLAPFIDRSQKQASRLAQLLVEWRAVRIARTLIRDARLRARLPPSQMGQKLVI